MYFIGCFWRLNKKICESVLRLLKVFYVNKVLVNRRGYNDF